MSIQLPGGGRSRELDIEPHDQYCHIHPAPESETETGVIGHRGSSSLGDSAPPQQVYPQQMIDATILFKQESLLDRF